MYLFLEITLLCIILFVATVCERVFFKICPYIWVVGFGLDFLIKFAGHSFCPWKEALISLAVLFMIYMFLYRIIRKGIGGGIIKGILMLSVFFGGYMIIWVITFVIVLSIINLCKKKSSIPGERIVTGMPVVCVSTIITMVGIYMIEYAGI